MEMSYQTQSISIEKPAAPQEIASESYGTGSPLRQVMMLFPLIMILAAFVHGDLRSFQVVSRSMCPTLQIGDCVVMSRDTDLRHLRGRVIAFLQPDESDALTKRVVAIEGDEVAVRSGRLYVNGQCEPVPRDRLAGVPDRTWRIHQDEAFVLGDNRNNSYDSIDYGPIPKSEIMGVLSLRYWPPNRAGVIQ